MTETDKAFEEYRPGYYIFEPETFERKCFQCNKKFETSMLLNKFCRPECKQETLDSISTIRR